MTTPGIEGAHLHRVWGSERPGTHDPDAIHDQRQRSRWSDED